MTIVINRDIQIHLSVNAADVNPSVSEPLAPPLTLLPLCEYNFNKEQAISFCWQWHSSCNCVLEGAEERAAGGVGGVRGATKTEGSKCIDRKLDRVERGEEGSKGC